MPQALAFVLPATFAAGGSAALFTAAGTLTGLGIGVSVGSSLLLNVAASALSAPSSTPPPEDVVNNFQASVAARQVHMGNAKVGGAMMGPPRSKAGKIYVLLAQMHGEMQTRTKHFIDGREVTLWEEDRAPFVTPAGPKGGYVGESQYQHGGRSMLQIRFRNGTDTQDAYDELTTAFGDWTADHRLLGIATALIIAESPPANRFNGMFPNRVPQYSSEGQWHKVLDPRTGATATSRNPIAHLRDYMLSPDGMGLSEGDLVAQDFIDALNDCDEVTATGPRYLIGGTYTLITPVQDVIRAILATCDGAIYQDERGRYGVRVGTSISASVSLSQDHLHSVLNWSNGSPLLQGYTTIKPKYTDESLGFVSETIDAWKDADLIQRYRQEITGSDPDFQLVPDHTQARFLAKIRTKKDNPTYRGKLRYNLHALKAIGQEYINIDLGFDQYGVEYSGPALIEGITLAGGASGRKDSLSYVDIDVAVIDPNTYGRTVAEQGTKPVLPPSDAEDGFPLLTSFAAAPLGVQTAQNTFAAGIGVTWDAPSQTSLSSIIEYAPTIIPDLPNPGLQTQNWQTLEVGAEIASQQIAPLFDGVSYDIRHAWKSPGGSISAYTTIVGISASAATAMPTPPQSLVVTDQGGGEATVGLTASAVLTIWKTEVLRDGVVIYSLVTSSDQPVTFTDIPGVGAYEYTARTVDVSGVASASVATTPVITSIA